MLGIRSTMNTRSRAALTQGQPENLQAKNKETLIGRTKKDTFQRNALCELNHRFRQTSIDSQKRELVKPRFNVFAKASNIPKPIGGSLAKPLGLSIIKESEKITLETPTHIDIDKDDAGDIFLLVDYVSDVYKHLKSLENRYPIRPDFLETQPLITPAMRSIVVDWMVDVHAEYHLLLETLHLSVSIFDRFLQGKYRIPKEKLQLVGITSLFVAAKYEETYPPDVNDFVYICASAYAKKEFFAMELKILETLDFCLGRPIPILFLRRFSKAAKSRQMHHTFAKYFLELALLNCKVVHYKPSIIAAGALYIAHCVVKGEVIPSDEFWTPTLKYYTDLKFDEIVEAVSKLASCIAAIHTSNLEAVRKKYASSKLCQVSLSPAVGANSKVIEQLTKLHNL